MANWRRKNKAHVASYGTTYEREHPEVKKKSDKAYYSRNKDAVWERNLRLKYGFDVARYQAMVLQQRGVCAICGAPPQRRRLDVDHDHKTKVVRGLLCEQCNRGIGKLQDSPEIIGRAIRYLERAAAELATLK